jgi:hypothetical protein
VDVFLNADEIAELDRQDPQTANDGGFQALLVRLQKGVDRTTGCLTLTGQDIERIQTYAFHYGRGSWEKWLRRAFERTLGPQLDGVLP